MIEVGLGPSCRRRSTAELKEPGNSRGHREFGGIFTSSRGLEMVQLDFPASGCRHKMHQFAFCLLADEDLAEEVTAAAFAMAIRNVDEAKTFPCGLSWLFVNLWRVVRPALVQQSAYARTARFSRMTILDIPATERAVLVLTDGFSFDTALTARICETTEADVIDVLRRARGKLQRIARIGAPNPHSSNLVH